MVKEIQRIVPAAPRSLWIFEERRIKFLATELLPLLLHSINYDHTNEATESAIGRPVASSPNCCKTI